MYDTLRPELITATQKQRNAMLIDPTAVVEKNMFLENPFPYLEVRRPFILGTQKQKWKGTLAHRFAELLHIETNKLTRVYTQNIDGLDFQCKELPSNKIIPVHGSIAQASCESCGSVVPNFDEFCNLVSTNIKDIYNQDADAPSESKPINCHSCGKQSVKPSTVLFGGSLPSVFLEQVPEDLKSADLLIVAGTSLVVSPANYLVTMVPDSCLRVIINRDPVGHSLGIEYGSTTQRDYFTQGDCEDKFLFLMLYLGWRDKICADSFLQQLPVGSQNLVRETMG